MITAFTNGRILTDDMTVADRAVLAEGERIRDVLASGAVPRGAKVIDLNGGILVPGFIDVQVNGGGGVLFNDAPTAEAIITIGKAHAQFGTTGFLPTIISANLDTIAKAIEAVDKAITVGAPGVLGIHVEGPFLSPARRGIHDSGNFLAIDGEAVALLSSLKHGKTIVTLAPEVTKPSVIEALAKTGVIVCAGHTDATFEETRAALASGVRGFTHLFNAMSPLQARAPGVVGAALDDAVSWCGIIADGRHVHPAALRLAFRLKGPEKLMLITDAMPTVGSSEKTFTLQGKTIRAEDGVCYGPGDTLAGTDLGMAAVLRNAMKFMEIDLSAASRMASANPAAFLGVGRETGRIAPGARADFVLLNDALDVRQAWIGGIPQISVP